MLLGPEIAQEEFAQGCLLRLQTLNACLRRRLFRFHWAPSKPSFLFHSRGQTLTRGFFLSGFFCFASEATSKAELVLPARKLGFTRAPNGRPDFSVCFFAGFCFMRRQWVRRAGWRRAFPIEPGPKHSDQNRNERLFTTKRVELARSRQRAPFLGGRKPNRHHTWVIAGRPLQGQLLRPLYQGKPNGYFIKAIPHGSLASREAPLDVLAQPPALQWPFNQGCFTKAGHFIKAILSNAVQWPFYQGRHQWPLYQGQKRPAILSRPVPMATLSQFCSEQASCRS